MKTFHMCNVHNGCTYMLGLRGQQYRDISCYISMKDQRRWAQCLTLRFKILNKIYLFLNEKATLDIKHGAKSLTVDAKPRRWEV